MTAILPEGFASIPEAIWVFAEILGTGMPAHTAVLALRKAGGDARFTKEELDQSSKALWARIDATHKATSLASEAVWIGAEQPNTGRTLRIEPSDLAGIPHARRTGTLAYLRSPHSAFRKLSAWLGPLPQSAVLMLRIEDLDRLAKNQRRSTRMQRKKSAIDAGAVPKVGRPSQQENVKTAILEIVEKGEWNRTLPLKKLTARLGKTPYNFRMSASTTSRAVSSLAERDDRFLGRVRRSRTAPRS
jgi:hypothetical protein